MKTPCICNKCEREKCFDDDDFYHTCECGGKMEVHYQDNYEKVSEVYPCHTCIHNTVGNGEKCNYCNNI